MKNYNIFSVPSIFPAKLELKNKPSSNFLNTSFFPHILVNSLSEIPLMTNPFILESLHFTISNKENQSLNNFPFKEELF